MVSVEGFGEKQLLQCVASLEKASEHSLAAAILAGAREKNVVLIEVGGFQSITGKGVSGTLQGKLTGIGNAALMQDLGANPEPLKVRAEDLQKEGQTVMFIAVGGRFAGLIAVADPIKESAAEAIKELKQAAITVMMVTGDNHTTAAAVAQRLGINFEPNVLPQSREEAQVPRGNRRGGRRRGE